jgi:prevent-host-death family protein
MTMVNAAPKSIAASAFKAKCLALMDEVARTGESIVITKNGKPVAQLAPAPGRIGARKPAFGLHKGMVAPLGDVDLDAPALEPSEWTADEANLDDAP